MEKDWVCVFHTEQNFQAEISWLAFASALITVAIYLFATDALNPINWRS